MNKYELRTLDELFAVPDEAISIERKAMIFAFIKHAEGGQKRKYSKKPYIVHPAAVVEIVRLVEHTPQMLAAAWLHDTVEDTNTTKSEIKRHFGEPISSMVEMLTDISKMDDGNRSVRKEIDRQHTSKASPEAKTIKLADLIHNSDSILEEDPGFAKVFLKEMRALLEVLKEGNSKLWKRADKIAN